ncbi:MAG TPA: Stf0 family sulfotransferase [Pilimelia sp.]|nr:Stf0 family sulfotransferase [Pilimelia sp.]
MSRTAPGTAVARTVYDLATEAYDRRSGHPRPLRTVLLCASRRTGSTLLGEALHRAGGLGCPLEYLHPGFRPGFAERWGTPDIAGYVAALYRHRIDATGTLGVKLFWPDLTGVCAERHPAEAASFGADLSDDLVGRHRVFGRITELIAEFFPNPTYVYLWRRDALRQAVSDHRAVRSGRWRQFTPTPPDETVTAEDVRRVGDAIARFRYQHQRWREFFAWQGVTPLEVTYEELLRDYPATARRVAAGLGAADPDAAAGPPRLRRQSDGLSEVLAARYLEAAAHRADA